MADSAVSDYVRLIGQFTNNEITAVEFERAYLAMFKNQQHVLSERDFRVLDVLFFDVDSFCSDPLLRGGDDLSEEQLREQCIKALGRLLQ